MMTVEEWTTIRYLHAQGASIRAIAEELGIARNTVRSAIRSTRTPRYERPHRTNAQLEPFATVIERMVVDDGFIGSRIIRELRSQGYTGGSTAVYSYLKTVRAQRPDPRITARFETDPGQQGQFDWSPYTIALGDDLVRVIVFCLTLGYSRRKCFWPSLDETAPSIYDALQQGLAHFGGAPHDLLIDNARALVANASPTHFRWNDHFLELCGHYGIKPVACQVARPQTKGKVERSFFHLEQQLIKGNRWNDLADFTAALTAFAAELDQTIHGTTRERPIDRFAREVPHLLPLPTSGFVGSYQALRQVSWDCLVSVRGTRYSVPWQHAGTRVWIRTYQGTTLVVTSQAGEEVARHAMPRTKGATVIDQSHYVGLRAGLPTTKQRVIEVFLDRFPEHEWFVEGLYAQTSAAGAAPLRAILGLVELYPRDALLAAFAAARQYHTYTQVFVRGMLEQCSTHSELPAVSAGHESAVSVASPTLTGDLTPYQQILEAAR